MMIDWYINLFLRHVHTCVDEFVTGTPESSSPLRIDPSWPVGRLRWFIQFNRCIWEQQYG
jgi:hypothetical protein